MSVASERAQREPGVFSPAYRALSIGVVLAVSLAGFEGLGVTTAMPDASAELGGDWLYGWAFTAFQLCAMVGTVAAGALADRRGPGLPLRIGLVVFAFGLLLGALAPTMPLLVCSRGLTGLGSGAIFSLNSVLIGRAYPERLQSRMLALASAAWVTPGLLGPGLAGLVSDQVGWRWVFAAFLPVVPIIGALILPGVRRLDAEVAPILDPTGERFWDATQLERTRDAVIAAIGVGFVLGGLSSTRFVVLGPFVVVGLAIAIRPLRRLLPPRTFSAAPGLPATTAATFLILGTFVGAEVFLPFVLDRSRGMSSTMAGVILTAGTLTWSIGSWVQSRNPPRWFVPSRMAGSTLLLSLGIVVTMLITVPRVPALIGYAGWTIGGLGMGIGFNAVSALTYTLVDKDRVGVAVGATGLAGALGAAVAAGISGALVNAADHRYGEGVTGLRWALAFQAMFGLTAGLVVLRAHPRATVRSR